MKLFTQFYNAKSEIIKAMKEPFAAKKIKRMLESAIDNSVETIVNLQDEFMKSLVKIEDINLDTFKKQRRDMDEAKKDIEFLQELYVMLFDNEYKIDETLDFVEAIEATTKMPEAE